MSEPGLPLNPLRPETIGVVVQVNAEILPRLVDQWVECARFKLVPTDRSRRVQLPGHERYVDVLVYDLHVETQ